MVSTQSDEAMLLHRQKYVVLMVTRPIVSAWSHITSKFEVAGVFHSCLPGEILRVRRQLCRYRCGEAPLYLLQTGAGKEKRWVEGEASNVSTLRGAAAFANFASKSSQKDT